MSKHGIIQGLEEALAYAKGDKTSAKVIAWPPKHTPTPWARCAPDDCAIMANREIIATTFQGRDDYEENYERREADAAFIVRAVNAHDALVEALEKAHSFIWSLSDADPDDRAEVHKLEASTFAALALAKGGQS